MVFALTTKVAINAGVYMLAAGFGCVGLLLLWMKWRSTRSKRRDGMTSFAWIVIIHAGVAIILGAGFLLGGLSDDRESRERRTLQLCAREMAVNINVLEAAQHTPDREMITVTWSDELVSYNEVLFWCEWWPPVAWWTVLL